MRRNLAAFSFLAFTLTIAAQFPPGGAAQIKAAAKASETAIAGSSPAAIKDLPVRKVVLYKNGVGYFEHAGTVSGNQRVTIDFTSPQLNDVLQSLIESVIIVTLVVFAFLGSPRSVLMQA